MISKKTLGLLAGASVASLLIAGGPGLAGQEFTGPFPTGLAIVADTDFVILDTLFNSGADVINSASIGPGGANSLAFLVEAGALIDGALINTSLATISAIDSVAGPATATALRIDGTVPQVDNHGDITAYANSYPAGPAAYAEANAIEYAATGLTDGVASLWNDGLIDAHADAFASYASGATATAVAVGVDQFATGIFAGPGSSALASVTNDGQINAAAYATAIATGAGAGLAYAFATATAIEQDARNAEYAETSVVNSGDITADAYALASALGDHDAYSATANAIGIDQSAAATGSDTSVAKTVVDNTGSILVTARAEAYAVSGDAFATDVTATGIVQNANNAEDAFAVVNNTGDVHATASATAFSTYSFADASVSAHGVSQTASANGSAGSVADAKITNESLWSIDALGNAHATGFSAVATASATAVLQRAQNAETAIALIENNGSISAISNAYALGTSDSAYAYAYAFGVFQTATGNNSDTSSATATIITSESITASAQADAIASYSDATATATATGVLQRAQSAEIATSLVANTGNIHATATANADAYSFASAYAYALGVAQFANANGSTGSVANAKITNVSDWSIDALANAHASGSSAEATGSATGVYQSAQNAETAIALIENSGSISAEVNATAIATSDFAYAYAYSMGVGQRASGNSSDLSSATATIVNSKSITASAYADAIASSSSASATATATGVYQRAQTAESATALLTNTGDIHATATANADAYSYAYAYAFGFGVGQFATANNSTGSVADAKITNSSAWSIDALANAHASGSSASATASATAVYQAATNAETAIALTENNGSISAEANATAIATSNFATATAFALGVGQTANANGADNTSSATATVVNNSSITASAYADAVASYSSASASATATGVYQSARDAEFATARVTNTGDIHVDATANASAYSYAYAFAEADGVQQEVVANGTAGSIATAEVTNTSLLSIDAIADAWAFGFSATATATAEAVEQDVFNAQTASALVDNSGAIYAEANAAATATYDTAIASAFATGVDQSASASTTLLGSQASVSVVNSGSIEAVADADAWAWDWYAAATASAYGVSQSVYDAGTLLASVENSGSIKATAWADADGTQADAYAEAVGVYQALSFPTLNPMQAYLDNSGYIGAYADAEAFGGLAAATAIAAGYVVEAQGDLALEVDNNGTIEAAAWADASNYAYASAVGIYAEGLTKSGLITNDGTVRAEAYANGTTGTALAVGIWDPSTETTVVITNTGLVSAYAEGPYAAAAGIVIDPLEEEVPTVVPEVAVEQIDELEPYATIHNDGGTIWAGIVETGQPVPMVAADAELLPFVERGDAIYTENAPNQVLISLTGNNAASHADGLAAIEDGYIFGNIDISDDDAIVVSDGKTWFDGIINPDFDNEGFLDIVDGGNLLLLYRNNGPSAAFVDEFYMDETGTLGVEFRADPTYHPFVSANEAWVDGRLNVVYQADLYSDFTIYEGVVDAGTDALYGSFDEVTDNSALLITSQFFDAVNDQIDVVVDRIEFGDVVGLTKNQQAVGDAIENVYDDLYNGSPEFENLVAHLFTFDDEEYPIQLNSLSGSEYAQYLQSVIWSTSQLNRTVTQRMECDGAWAANMQTASIGGQTIQPVADVVAEPAGCFEPGRVSLWADVSGSWNKQDGDKNAPGYDEDQYSLLVGADYAFDDSFYMGVAIGYLDSDMDFKWFGNKIDYDGLQLALYGGYDDTENYIRGILSYGTYDGSSHRYVSVEPSNPIDPKGNPDSDVFSFYGELGHRFAMGSETNVTPFAGLSLAQGEIDSFTESDPEGTGAALHVSASDGNSVASLLGLRLGGNWLFGNGFFTPEVSVAWMHEFDDERQTVKMSFADAPPGADFKVVGAKTARDSAVVNVGGTFGLTEGVDFSVIYDGRYSSDYSSSALIGRIGVKF